MQLNQLLPIILALISVMGGRLINEKSLKTLTNEERGMLIQNFSKNRIWSTVILMVIVMGYLILGYSHAFSGVANATYSYFGLLGVFMIVRFVINYRKLKTYNFPQTYYKLTLVYALLNFFSFACIAYFILVALPGEI